MLSVWSATSRHRLRSRHCSSEREVGEIPVQICDVSNRAVHVADYEGRPERRLLTREELQVLFDVADQAVEDAAHSARNQVTDTP